MSSLTPPSSIESFQGLTQLNRVCDFVYFYYVYKLECQAKGVGNTDIAAGLRGSPDNKGVGTFSEFIRHIIPCAEIEYMKDISGDKLDTLLPGVGQVRHDLNTIKYPCPDFKRLHKAIEQPPHASMMILSAYDAITDTFEELVEGRYCKLSGRPAMEGARGAVGLVFLNRPDSSDTLLEKHLEALKPR